MLVVGPFDTQLRTHDTHGTHHTKRKRKNLPVWREVEHMETLPNFHANAHAINILDIHRSLLHLTMMELMSPTTSSADHLQTKLWTVTPYAKPPQPKFSLPELSILVGDLSAECGTAHPPIHAREQNRHRSLLRRHPNPGPIPEADCHGQRLASLLGSNPVEVEDTNDDHQENLSDGSISLERSMPDLQLRRHGP